MDITDKKNCFAGESGLHKTLSNDNGDDSTEIVMRSPAKKQGLPTPSQSSRKDKPPKSSPKKSEEKDAAKRKTLADWSPNRSPSSSGQRRSRLSRDSNESGSLRARSTSSGKSRGRSSSSTKFQEEQFDSSPTRQKKMKNDACTVKRDRSVSKSSKKLKMQSPVKDSTRNEETEKVPITLKAKRGRPPKQNYSRDNLAKSIERVIKKYASFFSCNAKKGSKQLSSSKKLTDLPKTSAKRSRNSSVSKTPENSPTKKKRGRPKGSKNKKIIKVTNSEKSITVKKLGSEHLITAKHRNEVSDTDDSPPLKKMKFNTDDGASTKSKVQLKPKKMTKVFKLRKSSMKKGVILSKAKTSYAKQPKLPKKAIVEIKRKVGRPKKVPNNVTLKVGRKSQKQKEHIMQQDSSENIGEAAKPNASIKLKPSSPSYESERGSVIKEKSMLPIKKKYRKEYFSESDNTSGKEEEEAPTPIIKNPKKAFRDKWKREMKQKNKAEKKKLKEKPLHLNEANKKQRREQKPRAVTFEMNKTYDFTDSEDEADKETDSELEAVQTKNLQKRKGIKRKKSHLEVTPIRRTARMASLNAIAMMHCMNEDAKVSFSSSANKDELAVVPRKESTIARRHSDSDSDDSDSDTDHHDKPSRSRSRKKTKETSIDRPPKKRNRRRNELGVTMDIREMVVKKRMASLNASAIMAASFSLESRNRRIPVSYSSENETTDVDIKQKISYRATKEKNVKTRSVITVQETTKKVKKGQGRSEVEERIVFKKKVKRQSGGIESTDTDKDENCTDASENEIELLPKTPDSGMMIESTITYVTTQTLTMPKSAPGSNEYCLSTPNSKTTMVQHVSKKSSGSTSSSPNMQPKIHPANTGQVIATTNQHSFNPVQKYSPLGALSEMHPIMHPQLPPHHTLPYPPQHHVLQSQHPEASPYHHLGGHAIPPQAGPHLPLSSISHHASQYPPLSPHSPPYPPPSKLSPISSPSSTPHIYGSPRSSYNTPVSQNSPSSLVKDLSISPVSSPHNVPPQEKGRETPLVVIEERSQSASRSQVRTPNSEERHHSAFTAPTPSALSPVSSSHGYQPVSGPMPTGNTPTSSSYKPPQEGSPIPSFGPSSPRAMGSAKQYKHDYYPVPRHPSYHGHSYPYDKYLRGPPYQFYPHQYPPGGQFGAQGEYNYPAPHSGSMHCSQEYAYTLCIPGPPPQSHHQPLALPAPTSSSAPPNAGPQYYHYSDYAPVFAYPPQGTIVRINVLGPPGQNAICCSPSKHVSPSSLIGGSGKNSEGDNREGWGTGPPPYNYQYYNPPNNHPFPPYAAFQDQSTNRTSHCDKHNTQRKIVADGSSAKRETHESEQDSCSNVNSVFNASISRSPPEKYKLSNCENSAKQNCVNSVKCKESDVNSDTDTDKKSLPVSTSDAAVSDNASDIYSKSSFVDNLPQENKGDTDRTLKVADLSSESALKESRSDAQKNSKLTHVVPLPSASKSVTVPIAQNLKNSDVPPRSVPWICPVSSPVDDSSRNSVENSRNQSNCSDFSYTSTTSTISLSSSETQCSSVKSSTNPLVTSAEVNNCQDRIDFSTANGSSSVIHNNSTDHHIQPDTGVSISPDHIKEPKVSLPDQRSGMRHLLCQSQPLSHSKSTSVLVKAKPSNFLSAKSAAISGNKKKDASLDNSNNFTSTGPKNCYARSSEIPTDLPTKKSSVARKEGRNLTQPRKRGRPPKSKNFEFTKEDDMSFTESSQFLQFAQNQKNYSEPSFKTNELLLGSLDQNLNAVDSEAGIIKGHKNNFKMESDYSVKVEDISKKQSKQITKRVPIKSLNGEFNNLYENLNESDSKNNFNPISSHKLFERISMKREENNLVIDSKIDANMGNPKIKETVKELNETNLLKHLKFHHKTGKVGRPTKSEKLRRNVSLLSFLKEKNNESDTSVDMEIHGGADADDISPDKESAINRISVPFPPTSAQLQRKRRCSGLTKNKVTKKPKFSHGWSWQGDAFDGKVWLRNDENLFPRKCYVAMKHNQGDCLQVRDCVLLRSGTRRTDLPYVAKIAALWEDPDTSDMMMSILWYYRPEHTEYGRQPDYLPDDIFASKHRDHLSVACIDDRCYVLTYNEYCRYHRKLRLFQTRANPSSSPVPQGDEEYLRTERQPNECVVQDLLFVCRKVYDYRQKRILKNPCQG